MARRALLLFTLAVACAIPAPSAPITVTPTGTPLAANAPSASAAGSVAPGASAVAPSVAPRAAVTQLAARGDVTCARLADGAVRCWGDNQFNVIAKDFAPLGQSAIRRPRIVIDLPPVAEVVVGPAHACARLDDGTVRCWGTDDGTLGLGTPLPPGPPPGTERPMPVLGLRGVVSLSSYSHLCALLSDKSVTCWADYDRGNGDPRDAGSRAPVVVPGFANAVQIADGGNLACARLATGPVRCWNDVSPGLIPRGKVRVDAFNVAVRDVASIVVGDSGGCAITTSSNVSCWGLVPFESASSGVLTAARPIATLHDVVALALGQDLACAIVRSGDVLCDDASDSKPGRVPTKVAGLSGAVEIVVGASHACARKADGTVMCWGANDQGQLGDGTSTKTRSIAAPVVW